MSEGEPTILDIFSGIGGFSLSFHEAGFRTLAFVEWDDTKRIILDAHWPDIPKYRDIDEFDCGEFLRTHGRPDVIAGGVPCQAASLLGTRLGTADPRWKWPQAIRLARELRPRYFVAENPPALLTVGDGRAFNGIVSAMAALGYDCMWDVIPAAAFGAGHWRERLCIVFADAQGVGKRITPNQIDAIATGRDARPITSSEGDERGFPSHSDSERWPEEGKRLPEGESDAGSIRRQPSAISGEKLSSNNNNKGLQGHARDGVGSVGRSSAERSTATPSLPDMRGRVTGSDWWHEANSGVPVMVHGIPNRLVEAISLCAGDAIVPQAFYPIAAAIHEKLRLIYAKETNS